MPVPIAKVLVSLMRTLAWPIVSVVGRKIKAHPMTKTYHFYYWFGLKCFHFEAWIERTVI